MIEGRRKGTGLGQVLGFMLLSVILAEPVMKRNLNRDVEMVIKKGQGELKGEGESQIKIKIERANQDHGSD
jgi:hypothetical protein